MTVHLLLIEFVITRDFRHAMGMANTCMHACIRTCIHTYIQATTYIHTCVPICYTYIGTYVQLRIVHTRTCVHACLHLNISTCKRIPYQASIPASVQTFISSLREAHAAGLQGQSFSAAGFGDDSAEARGRCYYGLTWI